MSKFLTAALGAAVVLGMAGVVVAQNPARPDSAGHRGARYGQMGRQMGMRGNRMERGDHAKFMKDLNLTDAQKNQIKAIHAKYQPQLKALRDQQKPQFDAMRAARQKGDTSAATRARFKTQREDFQKRAMPIREQEQKEVRSILTADQRAKFDAAQGKRKEAFEARQKNMKARGDYKKAGKA